MRHCPYWKLAVLAALLAYGGSGVAIADDG
jgi:hypothetical protein